MKVGFRTTLLLLTLVLGFAAIASAQSIHYPVGKNMIVAKAPAVNAPSPFALVDPLFVVHQDFHGGPLSSFITSNAACVAAITSTPDNGVSPDGKTFSLGYTPYITVASQTLQNSAYIGFDLVPPPTCPPSGCKPGN